MIIYNLNSLILALLVLLLLHLMLLLHNNKLFISSHLVLLLFGLLIILNVQNLERIWWSLLMLCALSNYVIWLHNDILILWKLKLRTEAVSIWGNILLLLLLLCYLLLLIVWVKNILIFLILGRVYLISACIWCGTCLRWSLRRLLRRAHDILRCALEFLVSWKFFKKTGIIVIHWIELVSVLIAWSWVLIYLILS